MQNRNDLKLENCFVISQFSLKFLVMAKTSVVIVLIPAFFSLTLSQKRIFNGLEAEEKEFPYMVHMRQMNSLRCGGVLISNQYVLTAAHCLKDVRSDWKTKLVLGGRHFNDIRDPIEIDPNVVYFHEPMNFWFHEDFSMPSAVNDIAILELPRPVEFTDYIKPIEISTNKKIDENRGAEIVATIMGYGATQDDDALSKTLQKAQVRLIPICSCFQYQPSYVESITKNHICVFGVNLTEDHVVGPCNGDSGKQNFV